MSIQGPDKPSVTLSQMGPFEQLFKTHYPFVCSVIIKYVGDKTKVEDIAQEIFAELWTKREIISIHTSVPAYLRRMAVSRALNYLRDTKKYNWDDLDTLVDAPSDAIAQQPEAIRQLEQEELQKLIASSIEKLPEKCRIIFMLSRNDELSYSEIAQNLDISIKTVENQIGKALKYLRIALSNNRG
ncbi:MAG TPA: RNA polymerase sigma-70 factor [Saprospiraceae bacterium]|nr:RNA polymerase sigma-70 factor [Saprospiraceae bacterium]